MGTAIALVVRVMICGSLWWIHNGMMPGTIKASKLVDGTLELEVDHSSRFKAHNDDARARSRLVSSSLRSGGDVNTLGSNQQSSSSPTDPSVATRLIRQASAAVVAALLAARKAQSSIMADNMSTAKISTTATKRHWDVGPIWIGWRRREGRCYTWQAKLDRWSGVASARETSIVPNPDEWLHHRLDHGPAYETTQRVQRRDNNLFLLKRVERLFGDYPVWLCRRSITFNVLRAVPATSSRATDGTNRIQIRLLGILSLLEFGKPGSRRLSFHTGSSDSNNDSSAMKINTTIYAVTLPISGGLLARHPSDRTCGDGRKDDARSRPRNGNVLKEQADLGSMTMTLCHQHQQQQQNKQNSKIETNRRYERAGLSLSPASTSTLYLTTTIDGYRPWLVGSKVPVHPIRKWFYLLTQSVVHGYVMWRFHRHVGMVVPSRGQGQAPHHHDYRTVSHL